MVLLFFVERLVEEQRDRERRRMEQIALEQARWPLTHLLGLFGNMIKAAAPIRLNPLPGSLDKLFADTHLDYLNHLDLDGSAGTIPRRSWYQHLDAELKRVCDKLSTVVDKYVAFLDPDFVDTIEQICSSQYIQILRSLGRSRDDIKKEGIVRQYTLEGLRPLRDQFFGTLTSAVNYFDGHATAVLSLPNTLDREDVEPKTGSSRFTVPPESSGLHVGAGPPPGGSSALTGS